SAIRPRQAYQPTILAAADVFSDPLLGPLDRPVRRKVNRTGLETDDFLADAGADFGDHRIRIGWAEADHGSFHGGRPGAGPGAGLADNLAQLADQVFTSRDGREALREHHFGQDRIAAGGREEPQLDVRGVRDRFALQPFAVGPTNGIESA